MHAVCRPRLEDRFQSSFVAFQDEEEISTSPGVSEFVSDAFDACNLDQEDLRKEMEQLVLDKKEQETVVLEGTKPSESLLSSPVPRLTVENCSSEGAVQKCVMAFASHLLLCSPLEGGF